MGYSIEKRMINRQAEIDSSWQSWEHLLYERLERFDYFLETVQADLSAAGMKYEDSGNFLRDKIIEMNEDIQSKKSGVKRGKKAKAV